MPSPPNPTDLQDLARVQPEQARSERRCAALNAISGLNKQFVALLCNRAKESGPYPFDGKLRARFAGLADEEQEQMSRWGVSLMDAGFLDSSRWRIVESTQPPYPELQNVGRADGWLSGEEGALLAQATYLVAWSLLQWDVHEARVLLGMTPETSVIVGKLGVDRLGLVARQCAHWIVPRWAELSLAWTDLLNCAFSRGPYRYVYGNSYGTLRMLTLSGGHSPTLARHMTMQSTALARYMSSSST